MRLLPLFALGCTAGLVTSCAITPPVAVTPSPTAAPTLVSTSPTATASPTDSPATTSSASASATPSQTPKATPTAAGSIVLGGTGVGQFKLGTPEATVLGYLTARLGKPEDTYSGPVCELDPATAYGHQVTYGSASFIFESAPKKGRTAPRTLHSWIVQTGERLKTPLELAPGLPLSPTFAGLKTAFPTGKLRQIPLGEDAFWVFTTPSGVWYRGDDKTQPLQIGTGPQETCD